MAWEILSLLLIIHAQLQWYVSKSPHQNSQDLKTSGVEIKFCYIGTYHSANMEAEITANNILGSKREFVLSRGTSFALGNFNGDSLLIPNLHSFIFLFVYSKLEAQ